MRVKITEHEQQILLKDCFSKLKQLGIELSRTYFLSDRMIAEAMENA